MAREELKLVTDPASLGAGQLIVVRPCLVCGKEYSFMLLRHCRAGERLAARCRAKEDGWLITPCHRHGGNDRPQALRLSQLAERRFFRVDTGLEAPAETTKERKPVKVGSWWIPE